MPTPWARPSATRLTPLPTPPRGSCRVPVGIRHPGLPDAAAALDPAVAQAARGIGAAVAMRLVELAPALRPAQDDGSEPDLLIEEVALDPPDPLDPVTLLACLQAHDSYVATRGRPTGASPGALALARVLAWAARAEMLGRAPRIAWIGPPARRPDDVAGTAITASVRMSGPTGDVRGAAVALVS